MFNWYKAANTGTAVALCSIGTRKQIQAQRWPCVQLVQGGKYRHYGGLVFNWYKAANTGTAVALCSIGTRPQILALRWPCVQLVQGRKYWHCGGLVFNWYKAANTGTAVALCVQLVQGLLPCCNTFICGEILALCKSCSGDTTL